MNDPDGNVEHMPIPGEETSTRRPAGSDPTPQDDASLLQLLQAAEQEMLQADVRRSSRLDELLDADFFEFGASGRTWSRAGIIAALQDETTTTIRATDFKLTRLAPDLALLTYRAIRDGAPPTHSLRSSIWRRGDAGWRIVFHQGTPIAASA